jgi:coenzyme PQQ synthesis protein D (PqqD)
VSGTELIENDEDSHLEQVFVRSKTVVSRCVAGETLIVPVRGKVGDLASIYSFNGTGSLIWHALESPKTVAQLVGAVEQEYAVEHKRAEQDVHRFLDDMLSVDLVAARRAEQFAGESHVE